MSPGQANSRDLIKRVEAVRSYVSRSVGYAAAAWSAVALASVLVLAWVLAGAEGWAPRSPLPAILLGAFLAGGVVAALFWRRTAQGLGGRTGVASAMDAAAKLPDGTVLGSLEIAETLPVGSSPVLRDAALQDVVPRLSGTPAELSGPVGEEARRLFKAGRTTVLALGALVVLLAAVSPDRSRMAWAGLIHPLAPFSDDRAVLLIQPGDREVPRGESVEVLISAGVRDEVTVYWEVTGQVAKRRRLRVSSGEATTELPAVSAETRYWAESPDGARSRVHTLTPVDPLFVGDVTVQVAYPAHTGIPPEEFRGDIPPLVLPQGTRLSIEGRGSRRLGGAEIQDVNGEPVVQFTHEESSFAGEWVPAASGTYAWVFVDALGGAAAVAPAPLTITVERDAAPHIAFVYPEGDTLLPLNRRQPMVIEASDDYGLARVEVVAQAISSFGEASEPVTMRTDLGGTPAAIARPFLDVSRWELSPGDTIRYFARAIDNSPGGQVTQTAEYVLRVPQLTELERAAQEELEAASEGMDALAEEAAQADEEIRDLQREASQAGSGDEAAFENREQIRQALERQDALLQAVDSLQQELAELRRSLQDGGLADPELSEELEGLEENLEEMNADERREEMAETEQNLGEMDADELERAMEELAQDQERIREQLEESVRQFRQAAIDQDFEATSEEAQDLAREQQLLADAMEEGGEEELRAQQQEELAERAEDLQERLETLQERLNEAGEQAASARMQEARHQLSQARQNMQQAQSGAQMGEQQMSQGQQQNSSSDQQQSDAAQQAAQQMSDVSQEIRQAQQELQQEMAQAIQRALGQTANDALSLARRQADLREQMEDASREELAEMRGDEAALAQGLRNLAENYANGTQMAAPGARDLMEAVGRAMEGLEGTLEAMDGQRGRRQSPMSDAQSVIQALNDVAMMAMAAGQQGEGQSSSASGEQMMQQLQQLAQQQGDLMSEANTLQPMQLGQETLQQEMEEMAGEQERIAEELGDLSQEQSGEGEGEGQGTEELGDMAAEARMLAEAMAQGRLDPEVLRRQEELFQRLLDAGRTLEREEESEERESEAPGTFDRGSIETLTDADMDALRFSIPGAGELRGLSPAQRNLVLKYFQRLNQVEGSEATPPAGSGRSR